MFKKLIGSKEFYKLLLIVCVPIVLQQVVTSLVNLVDNVMIGQLGTEAVDAVSISNQFLFVFNLAIFGAISGPSIFATQFHGSKNIEGVKESIRYKLLIGTIILFIGIFVFTVFDDLLLNSFIHEDNNHKIDIALVITYGKRYLSIMLFGLPFFVVGEIYSSNLREAKQTVVPMVSSFIAVGANVILNFCLIFGFGFFPALGVAGAAIATVISRIISCFIVVIYAHANKAKYPFMDKLYRKIVSFKFTINVFRKTFILLINEVLWSLGMTLVNQCYSLRGLEVVAAVNIVATFFNLFSLLGPAIGNATSIILGQKLGANKLDEAFTDAPKFLFFSFVVGVFAATLMILTSNIIPSFYNVTLDTIIMVERLIVIAAIVIPVMIYSTCCYFIIRTGGKTFVTFVFDSLFMMVLRVPVAFCLARFTNLNIYYLYAITEATDLLKIIAGTYLVKKGIWINRVV